MHSVFMNEFTGFLFTPVLNFHSARIPLVLQAGLEILYILGAPLRAKKNSGAKKNKKEGNEKRRKREKRKERRKGVKRKERRKREKRKERRKKKPKRG